MKLLKTNNFPKVTVRFDAISRLDDETIFHFVYSSLDLVAYGTYDSNAARRALFARWFMDLPVEQRLKFFSIGTDKVPEKNAQSRITSGAPAPKKKRAAAKSSGNKSRSTDATATEKVREYIGRHPNLDAAAIKRGTELSVGQVKGSLKRLLDAGVIVTNGKRRGTRYSLNSSAGNSASHHPNTAAVL